MKSVKVNELFALFWPLLLLLLVAYLHLLPQHNSMWNLRFENYGPDASGLSSDYLAEVVQYHQTEQAFARRPLTTWLVQGLAVLGGISLAKSFVLLQLFLCWMVALALYALSPSHRQGLLNQSLFLFGFSLFFAWFPPIYTYDEPLQYLLLFGSVAAWRSQKLWLGMLLLTAALVARETSWLLWPAFFWLFGCGEGRLTGFKRGSVVVLVLYAAWFFASEQLFGVSQDASSEVLLRFTLLAQNFDAVHLSETSWMLFLVVGIPLQLSLLFSGSWPKRERQAFWMALLLNTVVVLATARAREARLFALPLILAWPWLAVAVKSMYQEAEARMANLAKTTWIYLLILPLAYFLAKYSFTQTAANPAENWFNEYLFVYLILFFELFWLKWMIQRMPPKA
jgi:hypothetical protein